MRIAVLILGLLLCAALRASDLPAGAIQISADQIPWKEGPPSLPKGSKVAVLEGNPGFQNWGLLFDPPRYSTFLELCRGFGGTNYRERSLAGDSGKPLNAPGISFKTTNCVP